MDINDNEKGKGKAVEVGREVLETLALVASMTDLRIPASLSIF